MAFIVYFCVHTYVLVCIYFLSHAEITSVYSQGGFLSHEAKIYLILSYGYTDLLDRAEN